MNWQLATAHKAESGRMVDLHTMQISVDYLTFSESTTDPHISGDLQVLTTLHSGPSLFCPVNANLLEQNRLGPVQHNCSFSRPDHFPATPSPHSQTTENILPKRYVSNTIYIMIQIAYYEYHIII